MTDNVCPPLGTGSVDLNALHEAAIRGAELTAAIEQATTRIAPEPEATPSAPTAKPGKASASAGAA